MNLLMKIDKWIGIILIVVGLLGFIFKWFSDQSSLIYAGIGLMLIVISATADQKK
ncbi:hypothetical protein [Companilactobacillus furfuricola]|uniref:hypothetical protein n=1 Tax=Companilactobacillus furfuricola TaxID=1462575 RepID=UPI0013DDC616|nr:hypothetical protein [Companilactobacillus furfuricola]